MTMETCAPFSGVKSLKRDEFDNFIKSCDNKNLPDIITIDNFTIGNLKSEESSYYINKDMFVSYLDWLTEEWWINLEYLFELMNKGIWFTYNIVNIASNTDLDKYPEQLSFVRIHLKTKTGEEKHFDVLCDEVVLNFLTIYDLGSFILEFECIFKLTFEDLLCALKYEREATNE